MTSTSQLQDRGTSLVEYALLVMVIALGSVGVARAVGDATADTFDEAAVALSPGADEIEDELTPKEKWAKAQEDYNQAIVDAKATQSSELAAAKAVYDNAVAANSSLPKAEKKTANSAAKGSYNAAKSSANVKYSNSVQAAKDAKTAAKNEYNATK